MYQFIAYIKFILSATNQHGVHSPFIYNFVTKCLYDKTKYADYRLINNYRQKLKSSDKILQVIDHGEGSKSLNSTKRHVNRMVNVSSSSKKEAHLLYRLSQYFILSTILELGTSLGVGTYAMALSNKLTNVTSIEGCKNTSEFAQSNLNKLEVENVDFQIGEFSQVIPNLSQSFFDCIYFDGHHNKNATIAYFEMLLPKTDNNSVFIFDDIYWSKGMTEAWQHIKNHESVSVTVDCFHLGFVFFRKEQAKEHFKIRL